MFGLLRRTPGYKLLIMVLVLLAIGVVAMLLIRGRRGGYDIDPAERYVVERATEEAALTLSGKLPMSKVLLMPLAGDDGFVSEELRRRLVDVRDFEIVEQRDPTTLGSLVETIKAFVRDLSGSRSPDEVSAEPAIAAAKRAGAPAVVFGKVIERGTADRRTKFGLALRAVKVDDGSTILAKAFDAQVRRSWTSGAYRRIWMRSRAWWGRMLLWLVVTAVLPLSTAGLVRPLLARESNAVNVALLGLYTLVDVLVAWLLLGFGGGGAVLVLVLLGALAGGVYNYVVCDRLTEAAA